MPRRDIRRDIIPERIVECGVTIGVAKVYKYLVTLGNHLRKGRDRTSQQMSVIRSVLIYSI